MKILKKLFNRICDFLFIEPSKSKNQMLVIADSQNYYEHGNKEQEYKLKKWFHDDKLTIEEWEQGVGVFYEGDLLGTITPYTGTDCLGNYYQDAWVFTPTGHPPKVSQVFNTLDQILDQENESNLLHYGGVK